MHAFGEIREEAQPASIAIAASDIHLLLDLNFITELYLFAALVIVDCLSAYWQYLLAIVCILQIASLTKLFSLPYCQFYHGCVCWCVRTDDGTSR
jgi:hypothetical protein